MSVLPPTAAEVVQLMGMVPHPEGGFFVETWRSGATPMTTMGRTATDVPEPESKYLGATDRGARSDGDGRRNFITSMLWCPTRTAPKLTLGVNLSDIIHNYHGGLPFEYIVVGLDGTVRREILGPDLANGHKLTVGVAGGEWKCGRVVTEASGPWDYSLLSESVAPGFDVVDFAFVTKELIEERDAALMAEVGPYLHDNASTFDEFYEDDEQRQQRVKERLGGN